MPELTVEALGFTNEELQERVVDRIVSQFMSKTGYDDEGNEYNSKSSLADRLQKAVVQRIDRAIADVIDIHILPNATTYVENITLQATNKWGERKGEKLTFIEYLVQRADAYLREEVDYQGKSKSQDSYNWKASQSRIAHLVHEHLHYAIETSMKQAVQDANNSIVKGLQETVKLKLAEVAAQLKVNVATK